MLTDEHIQKQIGHILKKMQGNFGLNEPMILGVGALTVAWGVFECNLETAIWRVARENPEGGRPSTDAQPVSDWIIRFRKECSRLPNGFDDAASEACDAAEDLLVFRNTIIHGWAVPPSVGGPMFIRNPGWFRTKRKRDTSDAHISEQTLSMAVQCADWLLETTTVISLYSERDDEDYFPPEDLSRKIHTARSYANELRHLSDLMNHEKY